MSDSFRHNDPPQPTMDEIERIKRYFQSPNQRIISASRYNQRNQVDDCERSGRSYQAMQRLTDGLGPVDHDHTKQDIQSNIACYQQCFEPGWDSSHVYMASTYPEFAIVPSFEQRCIEQMSVEPCFGGAWTIEGDFAIIVDCKFQSLIVCKVRPNSMYKDYKSAAD